MIRRLASPPTGWNGRLPTPPPGAVAVNTVDGQLAAYWNDDDPQAMTAAKWATYVAAASFDPPPEEANRATIIDQARAALAGNRTYIERATPTAAQTTAQVKALSRQVNGVIRLLLGQVDATD